MCESMESIGGRMQTICFCEGQVAELKPAGKQKKLESCSLVELCILVGVGRGDPVWPPEGQFKQTDPKR